MNYTWKHSIAYGIRGGQHHWYTGYGATRANVMASTPDDDAFASWEVLRDGAPVASGFASVKESKRAALRELARVQHAQARGWSSIRRGSAQPLFENPGRPPREWFRRCVKSVKSAGKVQNPNAICGSVWYHRMSDSEKRRITRESEGYNENPVSDVGLIATAAIVVGGIFLLLRPKESKAAPQMTPSCGTQHEVKSFIAARGMAVVIVSIIPSGAPRSGYDTEKGRLYNTTDCSFYRFLSLEGAKSAWTKDLTLNAEFAVWRAGGK